MEKREPFCSVGGNVNRSSHYVKTVWRFLKKAKVELPYDPAIPLLGIYLKKRKRVIQNDTCTPVSIAALFIIATLWKQAKCPSVDEWIKMMCSIHTHTCTQIHAYTVEYY